MVGGPKNRNENERQRPLRVTEKGEHGQDMSSRVVDGYAKKFRQMGLDPKTAKPLAQQAASMQGYDPRDRLGTRGHLAGEAGAGFGNFRRASERMAAATKFEQDALQRLAVDDVRGRSEEAFGQAKQALRGYRKAHGEDDLKARMEKVDAVREDFLALRDGRTPGARREEHCRAVHVAMQAACGDPGDAVLNLELSRRNTDMVLALSAARRAKEEAEASLLAARESKEADPPLSLVGVPERKESQRVKDAEKKLESCNEELKKATDLVAANHLRYTELVFSASEAHSAMEMARQRAKTLAGTPNADAAEVKASLKWQEKKEAEWREVRTRVRAEMRELCPDDSQKATKLADDMLNSPIEGRVAAYHGALERGTGIYEAESALQEALVEELGDHEAVRTTLEAIKGADSLEARFAVLVPLEVARANRVGATADFEDMRKQAEVMARKEFGRVRAAQDMQAGYIRASGAMVVVQERLEGLPQDGEGSEAESYAAFLKDGEVEQKLAILYSGLTLDPPENGKLMGALGREMALNASNGRVPKPAVQADGTLQWTETRAWLGLPREGTPMTKEERVTVAHWEATVEALNRAQRAGCETASRDEKVKFALEQLNPGIAAVMAVNQGPTYGEQVRRMRGEDLARANDRQVEAQIDLVAKAEWGDLSSEEAHSEREALRQVLAEGVNPLGDPGWRTRVTEAETLLKAKGQVVDLDIYQAATDRYDAEMRQAWAEVDMEAVEARVLGGAFTGGTPLDEAQARHTELVVAYALAPESLRTWAMHSEGRLDSAGGGEHSKENDEILKAVRKRHEEGRDSREAWTSELAAECVTPAVLAGLSDGTIPRDAAKAIADHLAVAPPKPADPHADLLAEVTQRAHDGMAYERTAERVEDLDLGTIGGRMALWKLLDYSYKERAQDAVEQIGEKWQDIRFQAKMLWANRTMGNVRTGARIATKAVTTTAKMGYAVGSSVVHGGQALVQALLALQKAQEAAAQGDLTGAAGQVFEGGMSFGRAGISPISGGLGAAREGIEGAKAVTEIPHDVRQKQGRLFNLERMTHQLRMQEAQAAAQNGRAAAEGIFNYTSEFRRAADHAWTAAMATDPEAKAQAQRNLETSRTMMRDYLVGLQEQFPETVAFLEANGVYSQEGLGGALDRIETLVPERYRNVFGRPHEVGIAVPMRTDRDGRAVPASVHGDGAPMIDFGRVSGESVESVGATLGVVVEGGKLRFAQLQMDDAMGANAKGEDLGGIPVGKWDAFETLWRNMETRNEDPHTQVPDGLKAPEVDPAASYDEKREAERVWRAEREGWDTFRKLKKMGLGAHQVKGVTDLDKFSAGLGGDLRGFSSTRPNHADFQTRLTATIHEGDPQAIGFANSPEGALRAELESVDRALELMKRRTTTELTAFMNAVLLQRAGDRTAEFMDAIETNDKEFGW